MMMMMMEQVTLLKVIRKSCVDTDTDTDALPVSISICICFPYVVDVDAVGTRPQEPTHQA